MHFENIIADTTKRTDKATFEGKRRQLQKADVLLLGALFFDLLEPARMLRLATQQENVNLIKIVNSIDSTRNNYQCLLNRIEKEPETVYELPRMKALLLKVKS